jgi:RNA polymerase sigma-70 factor (ECF subfamily)
LSDPWSDGRSGAEPQEDRGAGGDGDLVRRAAEGDVEAYEMLYRKHVGRVHALCLRMMRDRSEAEELTQETFVRVWERLGSFRGESALSTWLHRVTVNVVVGELRRRGRWRERFIARDATEVAVAQPAFASGSDLDLERAIAGLSPQARLVFVLHDVEGYKHGEIAELTGLAVGTSKAHLHRARLLLREELSR